MLLDNIVAAMYTSAGPDQKLAQQTLAQFQEHPDAWQRVPVIMQQSTNSQTKYIALQILDKLIATRWKVLPVDQQQGIRNFIVELIVVMSSGAMLIMWLGEIITEKGVGNGMSLLIFAGIATQIPSEGAFILQNSGGVTLTLVILALIALVIGIVFIEQGQRRIPVQYAKRMVGRRQYGGSSTYLPLKVNQAGVIPVIFASSLMYVPVLITQIVTMNNQTPPDNWWMNHVMAWLQNPGSWQYILAYVILIIFFSYFYVSVQYDPIEQADNMKKYGGFIPGIRPGRPTAEYLAFVMNRLLFVGSIYLALIAVLPNLAMDAGITGSGRMGMSAFGGTAILIMVSVALTTVKQIESQLLQSNYEGLLR